MRTSTLLIILASLVLCTAPAMLSQSKPQALPEAAWSLPQGLAVKDAGPRTYKFSVDYTSANVKGEVFLRQRLAGEYTRGLPGGDVMWKSVTLETANGPTAPLDTPQKREFMEGFRYKNDLGGTMSPDFFKAFPPTAVMERNLIWDTGMFELFGQNYFEHLKLNEPYHAISNESVDLPGVGTFHNRDIVLQWVGRSRRNGQDCAVVQYQAFFNPLEIATGGMTLNGRSHYWGEIWVSLTTKQVEYATLFEVVIGDVAV